MTTIRYPSINIEGTPNQGKTTSLRALAADADLAHQVLYISGDDKALPWFGANNFKRYTLPCPTLLPSVIKSAAATGEFKVIIVDTLTRIAENYQSRFIGSEVPKYAIGADGVSISDPNYVATTKTGKVDGMKGWGRMSSLIRDIMAAGDASGCQMTYFNHMAQVERGDGSVIWQAPFQGQIGKIGLESYFTISFVARSVAVEELANEPTIEGFDLLGREESRPGTGTRYVFQVEKDSNTTDYPIRTIDGMFPEGVHFIDNDLGKLLRYLEAKYAENGNDVTF